MRSSLLGWWLALGLSLAGAAAPLAGRYVGRPLADALRDLQGQGLAIVFTSALVPPDLVVVTEPTAGSPRQVLDQLLAPHGLAAREEAPGLLVVVAAGAPPGPVPVEPRHVEPPRPMPVLREEIEVRPSRLSLLEETSSSSAFAFDRDEMERLPHLAGDLFRATSLLPGIAAEDTSAQFRVRGGRPDEVKVVLDGQELYGAFHLQDYGNALSLVPSRLLASASLLTGALPASQGDRMGGVLDLRTQPPPAGRRWVLGLSVLDALASAAGGLPARPGGWSLTARRGSLALAKRAIGNEDSQFWDLLGKAEVTTAAGRLALHALAASDTLEVDSVEEDAFERLSNRYRSDYVWLTHQAGGARLLVETVASWARIRSDRRSDVDEEKGRFSVADRRRLQALGLSQTATLALATHALEGGWEARRYDADFDYFARRRPEILIFGPYAARRPRRRTFEGPLRGEHVGAWLREVRTWGELTGELGLRYDHHDATGDDLLSPRLSAAWRPAAPLLLRLAWGRFFQSQRPYELGVADGETRLRAAERSDQWVVGLEAAPPSRATHLPAVRLEVYHRRVDDPRPRFESLLEPVNFFPEIEPDRALIVPRSSREQGVELLVRGARTPPGLARGRLGWWLAYAWSRAVDEVGGRDVPRPLDQPHTLTLACDLRLPREWQLDLAWRWHTGWPTTPVTPLVPDEESDTATAVFGTLAGERLPTYHRLDLRASRRWPTRRGSFGFFVDAQNVYARRNQAGFDVVLDDDGRVRLDRELWPGIVPSLGVTWQIGE